MALSQTQTPTLAAYRDFDPHDTINGLFACATVPTNKGTIVTIQTASGNPNFNQTGTGVLPGGQFTSQITANYGYPPAFVTAPFFGIANNLVRAANSGDIPLGMTIVDCAEYNKYGESFASRPDYERIEQQVVLSGESVLIATRGIFTVNSYIGTPSPNTGAYASGGYLVVCPYNRTLFPNLVGKFIEPAVNGFALFKLEL